MKRIFIIGVEGSGTTMLSRILGEQPNCVSILGNYISEIIKNDTHALRLAQQLNIKTQELWDTISELEHYNDAKMVIPENPDEIAQLLFIFESSNCLKKLIIISNFNKIF